MNKKINKERHDVLKRIMKKYEDILALNSCGSEVCARKLRNKILLEAKGLSMWIGIPEVIESYDRPDAEKTVMTHIEKMKKVKDYPKDTELNKEGLSSLVKIMEHDNGEFKVEDLIGVFYILMAIKLESFDDIDENMGVVSVDGLLVDDENHHSTFVSRMTIMCMICGVKLGVLMDYLILISCFEILEYSKINFEEITIDEQRKKHIQNMINMHNKNDLFSMYKSIETHVIQNCKKVYKVYDAKPLRLKGVLPELLQYMLDNSYDAVYNSVKKSLATSNRVGSI